MRISDWSSDVCSSDLCLVLCDGFYEFTDPTDKTQKRLDKWLFTLKGDRWFCMAGIWREYKDGEAFTLLTMDSGPDIAAYHHRQIIPMARDQWAAWLDTRVQAADALKWQPEGSPQVAQVYGKQPTQEERKSVA